MCNKVSFIYWFSYIILFFFKSSFSSLFLVDFCKPESEKLVTGYEEFCMQVTAEYHLTITMALLFHLQYWGELNVTPVTFLVPQNSKRTFFFKKTTDSIRKFNYRQKCKVVPLFKRNLKERYCEMKGKLLQSLCKLLLLLKHVFCFDGHSLVLFCFVFPCLYKDFINAQKNLLLATWDKILQRQNKEVIEW